MISKVSKPRKRVLPRTISIRLGDDEVGRMINDGLEEIRHLDAYQAVKADAMLVTMLLNEIIKTKLGARKNQKE
jgi:hypothetical protein